MCPCCSPPRILPAPRISRSRIAILKPEPYYRIVVADSRFPRDGRCIEEIGTYDPKNEANAITIDADKAKQWIKNGAQPSDTVRGLLKKANVL